MRPRQIAKQSQWFACCREGRGNPSLNRGNAPTRFQKSDYGSGRRLEARLYHRKMVTNPTKNGEAFLDFLILECIDKDGGAGKARFKI